MVRVENVKMEPYGKPLSESQDPILKSHRLGIAGLLYSNQTGTYNMGARHYDLSCASFSQPDVHILENRKKSQDPYQLHLNNYARNNPLKYTDPDGEFIPLIALGVGVVLIFNPIEMGQPDEDQRVAKETAMEVVGGKVIGKAASYAKPVKANG